MHFNLNEQLGVLNLVLPRHLWITVNLDMFHLDNPYIEQMYTNKSHVHYRALPYSLGYVTIIQSHVYSSEERRYVSFAKPDFVYAVIYKTHQNLFISFYEFLVSVNGEAQAYKENMILLTGENPWKTSL